jgi:hypothetical protein
MNQPEEGRLPDELEGVAARLRADRAQADSLKFDDIKQRVIARCAGTPRRSTFMKSRFATLGTVVALIAGTGGAIAVASGGSSGGPLGGAANAQYCHGKPGPCKPPPKKHHHCGKHHNKACPKPKKHHKGHGKGNHGNHGNQGHHKGHGKGNHGNKGHHKGSTKSGKSTGTSGGSSKCTVTKQNGLTVVSCP